MNTAQVNTGGRKQYIDFAKGIVAISVVIGHLVPFNGLIFRWIFGFHMPFFFLLYGYMQKNAMPAFGDFVRRKVKRLLIPSWCYRFVYHIILGKLILQHTFSVKQILFTVFWDPYGEWFLPVMFWVSIGMYLYVYWLKKLNNMRLSIVLTAILVSTMTLCRSKFPLHNSPWIPFQLDGGALALTFAIIGYWMNRFDILQICLTAFQKISRKVVRFGVMAGALGIYTFFSLFNTFENYVNMADNECGNDVVTYFMASVLMFLILCIIGNLINRPNGRIVRWTCLMGKHSMLIYLGHIVANRVIGLFARETIDRILGILSVDSNSLACYGLIQSVFYFVVSMAALTVISLCLDRYNRKK